MLWLRERNDTSERFHCYRTVVSLFLESIAFYIPVASATFRQERKFA
jgi:hypothetical protein